MATAAFYKIPIGSTLVLGVRHASVIAKDGGVVTMEMQEGGELEQYSMEWIQENLRTQKFGIRTPQDETKKEELKKFTGDITRLDEIKDQQERLNVRAKEFLVVAMEELEAALGHKLSHSFLSREGPRNRIIERAKELARDRHIFHKAKVGSTTEPWDIPQGRTLARWLKNYRHFGRNPVCLMNRHKKKGPSKGAGPRRLSPAQLRFVEYAINVWKDLKKPKFAPVYELAKGMFKVSAQELADGFVFPTLATMYNHKNKLSKKTISIARDGLKHAKNLLGAGKTEIRALEFGEAVETDQMLVSLFIKDDGSIGVQVLSAEEADQEPEPNEIRRIWLHYLIDLATRMPLAWVLADSADSDTTMQLLRMASRSKERERVRYGCKSEPTPAAQIRKLISDNGNAVRNERVVGALMGMGITYVTTRTYHANDKPFVESAFGSFEMQVVGLERGYTGGKPGALPGSDPRGEARLSLDEFYGRITRYFIDEYPHQKHRGTGMFGATPQQKLREVSQKYEGIDMPCLENRILHLGMKKELKINSEGVQPWGLPFNSTELQLYNRDQSKRVTVHLDPDCLHHVLITADGHIGDPIKAEISMTAVRDLTLKEYLRLKEDAVSANPELKAVDDEILSQARKRRARETGMFPDSNDPLNYGRDLELERMANRLAQVETRPCCAGVGTVPPGSITDRSHPSARAARAPSDPATFDPTAKKFNQIKESKL